MPTKPLKIIFAGTPLFSAAHLQALFDNNMEVCAVLTQPDKPSGRGQKLTPSPVKVVAKENNLPIFQPTTLKDENMVNTLRDFNADIIVVVAYGLLIPKSVLTLCPYGCINVHTSLLPKWRGAAPILAPILAGDKKTGVTIMQLDAGWDTGPILLQESCDILPDDTTETLHDRLLPLGAKTLIEALNQIDQLTPKSQDHAKATYVKKIDKQDCFIDWKEEAIVIERKIRAYNPWPILRAKIGGVEIKIWKAIVLEEKTNEVPGKILLLSKEGVDVATGKGILRLKTLQFPGKKALDVADLLNSKREFFIENGFE